MTKPKITKKNNTQGQKQPKTPNGLLGALVFLIVFPCLVFLVIAVGLAIGFSNRPTLNNGANYSQTIEPEISEFEKYLHKKYGYNEGFKYIGEEYNYTNHATKEGIYVHKFTSNKDKYFLVKCTVKDGVASFSDEYETE